MEIRFIPEVRAFVIKGFFSEQECSDIMSEQMALMPYYKLPQHTGTALNIKTMLPNKKNIGMFLDQNKKFISVKNTLKILDKNFIENLSSHDKLYDKLNNCLIANTLISYYRDGDYYAAHTDVGNSPQASGKYSFTITHYVVKEPLSFSGGELLLYYKNDGVKDVTIPVENNMTVIFSSNTPHKVNKVSVNDQRTGYGRFCITNFVHER